MKPFFNDNVPKKNTKKKSRKTLLTFHTHFSKHLSFSPILTVEPCPGTWSRVFPSVGICHSEAVVCCRSEGCCSTTDTCCSGTTAGAVEASRGNVEALAKPCRETCWGTVGEVAEDASCRTVLPDLHAVAASTEVCTRLFADRRKLVRRGTPTSTQRRTPWSSDVPCGVRVAWHMGVHALLCSAGVSGDEGVLQNLVGTQADDRVVVHETLDQVLKFRVRDGDGLGCRCSEVCLAHHAVGVEEGMSCSGRRGVYQPRREAAQTALHLLKVLGVAVAVACAFEDGAAGEDLEQDDSVWGVNAVICVCSGKKGVNNRPL